MTINVNSEAFCRKAYLNYHCYGNTMNLTSEDMGKITQAWSSKLSSWQLTVASDENEYDFDNSEYSNYIQEGEDAAKKTTGYNGKDGGNIAKGAIEATTSVAGAAGMFFGGAANIATRSIVKEGGKLVIKKGAENIAKSTAKTAAGKAVEKAGGKALAKSLSWSISAPLALATAIMYLAKKTNKEEKEACDKLQTEMTGAQAELGDKQAVMSSASSEIIDLSDEANTLNEDTNEEIKDQKTEYDLYYQSLLALQEKIDAGEPLSDSEKALYKDVVEYINEIGINIEELSDDTGDEVSALYDEIGGYQEDYDATAESMGEIEGLTDFAESFDKATRNMCYVEAAAQTINAASGIKAGIQAGLAAAASMGFNAWAWACAAMGASAGVMSGIAAKEQFQWAGEVGTEIEMRSATQDLNAQTMDIYTEEIDAYDGYLQGVEDLELEIPDDIEAPENISLPNNEEDPTGKDAIPDVLKPKKEEEKK